MGFIETLSRNTNQKAVRVTVNNCLSQQLVNQKKIQVKLQILSIDSNYLNDAEQISSKQTSKMYVRFSNLTPKTEQTN